MSMRSLFVVFIAVFIIASCKNKKAAYNGNHIPSGTMQKILMDINVAEAYSITRKDSLHRIGTKNMDSLRVYYKEIFAHYHITEQEFNESLDWYKNHPDDLDSIYNKMIPVVTRWQDHPSKQLPATKF